MSVAGILPFQKQPLYNKGILIHTIVYYDAPDYLTQLFPQSTTPTRGITCIYQDQGSICLKVDSHFQVRPSGILYPQISNRAFLFQVSSEIGMGIFPRTTCHESNSDSLVSLFHCLLHSLLGKVYPLE